MNHLLADDSQEMSNLISPKFKKSVTKFGSGVIGALKVNLDNILVLLQ